jgi:hypothetical protein
MAAALLPARPSSTPVHVRRLQPHDPLTLLLQGQPKVVEGSTGPQGQQWPKEGPKGPPDPSRFPLDATAKHCPAAHRLQVSYVTVRGLAYKPLNHEMVRAIVFD